MSIVIIGGGRHFTNMHLLEASVITSGFKITTVYSGACLVDSKHWRKLASGADGLGELWALHHGIRVVRFYADLYGTWPSCGPRRNEAMGEKAKRNDPNAGLIALPGGSGTASMVAIARKLGLNVYEAQIL